VLVGNKKVFEHSKFSKNIYDVKIENYRLKFLENLEENPQIIEEAKQNNMNIPDYVDAIVESNREQIVLQFYTDLVEIVKNPNI
jgi:hypothetical protein